LAGQPIGSSRFQFSLTQNYDFDKNGVYEYGAQAFEANLGVTVPLSSRITLRIVGGGGVTALGAVDSLPLPTPGNPIVDPIEPEEEAGQGVSEGPRTFDYGPGSNFAARMVFRYDDREFLVLSAEGRHIFVVDGVRANHLLQRFAVDLLAPLRGALGIGVSGEYFDRRTYFKDVDETRQRFYFPQFRVFLTWRLS
jgi:hypothetical protein